MGKKKSGKGKKKAAGIQNTEKKVKKPNKQNTSAIDFFWAVRVLKKVAIKPIQVSPQKLREVLAKSPHALTTAPGKGAVLNALQLLREDLLHVLVEAGATVQSPNSPEDEGESAGSGPPALCLSPDGAVVAFLARCATFAHNQLNDLLRDAASADAVKVLLGAGALPNYFGSYGCTAVHEAAYCGRTICLFTLLQRGGLDYTRSAEGRTPLHAAAIGGSKACVEVLLKVAVNVDNGDYCDMTALHFAAGSARSAECVPLLIAAGADVNAKDKFDMTPLHYAAASGTAETVKILLDEGADRDALDKWFQKPGDIVYTECDSRERKEARAPIYWLLNPEGGGDELMWENIEEDFLWDEEPPLPTSKLWQEDINILRQLACFGDVPLKEIKALLKRSAPLVSSFSACKALQTCAEIGRLEVINLFVKKGASPHIRESDFCSDDVFEPFVDPGYLTSSSHDWPLIHIAAAAGHVQTVETLLSARASHKRVRVSEYADPFGPLEAAAANGHLAVVKYLLFWGCVTDREQLGGALRLAVTPVGWQTDCKGWVEETQTRIATTLLDAGADPNAQDAFGHTPILGAAYCGWTKCLSLLIRRGSNVLVETSNGKTALHAAACGRHTDCVSLLIKAGANVSSMDCLGQTPLHYVAEGLTQGERVPIQCLTDNGVEIVKELVGAGADVHCQDKNGATALHLAAKSCSIAIIDVLLNTGALINIKDRNGRTPLHYATDAGADDAVDKLIKSGADTNTKDCRGRTPKNLATLNSASSLKCDVENIFESEDSDTSDWSGCGFPSEDDWVEESSDDDTDDWELEYYRWVKDLCERYRDTKEGIKTEENQLEQNAERKPNIDIQGQSLQGILLKSVRDVETESEDEGSDDSEEVEDNWKSEKNREKIIELSIKWRQRGYVNSDPDFERLMNEVAQHTYLSPEAVSNRPSACWYDVQWIKGNSEDDDQKPSEVKPESTNIEQMDNKVASRLKDSPPCTCDHDGRAKIETEKLKKECKGQSNFVQDTKMPLVKQERDSSGDSTPCTCDHNGRANIETKKLKKECKERSNFVQDTKEPPVQQESDSARDETIEDDHEYAKELRIKVELNGNDMGYAHNEQNVPYVSGAWTRPQRNEECTKEEREWWNGTEPEGWWGGSSPHVLRLPDESGAARWQPGRNSSLEREDDMEYGDKKRSSVWFRLGKQSSDGDSDSRHNSIVVTRILSENEEEVAVRYVQENSLDEWEARENQEREGAAHVYDLQRRITRDSSEREQYQGQELNSPDIEEGYSHGLRSEEAYTQEQVENVSSTERWVRECYESSERIVYVQDPSDCSELSHEPKLLQKRRKRSSNRGWSSEDSLGELQTGTRGTSCEPQEGCWGRETHYSRLRDKSYGREKFASLSDGRRGISVETERGLGYKSEQTRQYENDLKTIETQDTIRYHAPCEAREKYHDQEEEGSHVSLKTQGDDRKGSRQYGGQNRDWSHGSYNERSGIYPGDRNAARSYWERQGLKGRQQREKRDRSHEREYFEPKEKDFGDRRNHGKRVSEETEDENFEYEDQLRKQRHDYHRKLDARENEASCSTPRMYVHERERYEKLDDEDQDGYHYQARSNEGEHDRENPCETRGNADEGSCSQSRMKERAYRKSRSPNSRYNEQEPYRSTSHRTYEREKTSETRGYADEGSHSDSRIKEHGYRKSWSPNNRYNEQEPYRSTSHRTYECEKTSETRGYADEGSHSESRIKEHGYRRSRSPNSRYNEHEPYRSTSHRTYEREKTSETRGYTDEGSHSDSRIKEHGYRRSRSPSSRYNEQEPYRSTSYRTYEREKTSETRGYADEGSHSERRIKEHGYRKSRSPNSRYNEEEPYRSTSHGTYEYKKISETRGYADEGSYSQDRPEGHAYRRSQSPNSRYDREHSRSSSYSRQEREKNSQTRGYIDDRSRSPCSSRSRFTKSKYGGTSERARDQSESRYSGPEHEQSRHHCTSREYSRSRSRSPFSRFGAREHETSGRQDRRLHNECRVRERASHRSRSPLRRRGDDLHGRLSQNRAAVTECHRSQIQYSGSDEWGFMSGTQHSWPDILKDVPH